MAQFGSVLEWGSRGRKFESSHPDHKTHLCPTGKGVFFAAVSFRLNERKRKNGFLPWLFEAAYACDITLNFLNDYSIMRKNGEADMPYNGR